jgi:hypothetical protein
VENGIDKVNKYTFTKYVQMVKVHSLVPYTKIPPIMLMTMAGIVI